jgi:phenylalanyl-tRNA synthetase beta chain
MQFPESWLRAFVNPPLTTDALAHRLTMAGLEVEETTLAAPPFSGVVVSQIVDLAPHPNADKLRVCQLDDGSGQRLQVVCGAPNAAAGLKVPLARVGAELPGGMKIGRVNMRGVFSEGMLCSARELSLSQEEGSGLLELPADLPCGLSLREALVLDDTIFTLKLTPNRADCLSIVGIAREVAALAEVPLSVPSAKPVPVTLNDRLSVRIDAPELCGRFVGRIIRGVNARAATPAWMKTRLERAGQRCVSALVDISNYVMLEWGQPSHLFDLDKIQGELTVRWAKDGESIRLLNGQTVSLNAKTGVVAVGDRVESVAGIMGGDATAVTLATQNVYLEAAFWWPQAIAGRARHYKCSSEAAHRFERGVDYANIPQHIDFMTGLILDICGGQAGPLEDQLGELPQRAPIRMRLARCHRLLGVPVNQTEVAQIFTRLGLRFTVDQEDFIVDPPSYRFDLQIEEDLIEEVARIYGFERIPAVPPKVRATLVAEPQAWRGPHALRRLVASQDYQEVVNYSFVEEDWERDYAGNSHPIRLVNPIASHLSVMRSSLMAGLVANIRHNAKHHQTRVRVFELGRVYRRNAAVSDGAWEVIGVSQPLKLAGAAWGHAVPEQWGMAARQVDFYDVKMDVQVLFGIRGAQLRFEPAPHPALHPGRSARIRAEDGKEVGWMGELHPRWTQQAGLSSAPVVFELDVTALSVSPLPAVREISRQPVVIRDLALWVDVQVTVQAMVDTIVAVVQADPELAVVQDIRLFDVWREKSQDKELPQEKSLAFRFWLQDTAVTLDEARVAAYMGRIKDALIRAHGARLRA